MKTNSTSIDSKKNRIYTTGGDRLSNGTFSFNKDAFIHNLLLFEEMIILSPKLDDIEELIRLLGVDIVIELMNSKAIKIDNSASSIGSLGLETVATKQWCHVDPKVVHLAKLDEIREKRIEDLKKKFSITNAKTKALNRGLGEAIYSHNPNRFSNALKTTETIFIGDKDFLIKRISEKLLQKFSKSVLPNEVGIEIKRLGSGKILIESNLCELSGISPSDVFKIIEGCFLEISRPFATAEIAGETEATLALRSKETEDLNVGFSSMLKGQSEYKGQENLIRILNIAGLPSFGENFSEIRFDKIFQLRESSEIQDFRDWNQRLSGKSDEEISEMFNSINARVSELFHAPLGKLVRIGLATTLNPAVGLGWALTEAFVLDQLFKRNSMVAFVNDELSSLVPINAKNTDGNT